MSAKRLSRGAKALRGSYEAASHLREAIGEHNIELSRPADLREGPTVQWPPAALPSGPSGVGFNDLLCTPAIMIADLTLCPI
jgi:hypothetical protein